MSHLVWSVEDGLHIATRAELVEEATRCVRRAQSLRRRWGGRKREYQRLMSRASHLFQLVEAGDYDRDEPEDYS